MKTFKILVLFLTLPSLFSFSVGDIKYKLYPGYFVKNDYTIAKEGNFLKFNNLKDFDVVFGSAYTTDKNEWITDGDLKNNFIVTVIKDAGNKDYNLTVKKITHTKDVIKIEYDFKLIKENLTYTSTRSIVALLENKPYKKIEFVENGKLVKTIKK